MSGIPFLGARTNNARFIKDTGMSQNPHMTLEAYKNKIAANEEAANDAIEQEQVAQEMIAEQEEAMKIDGAIETNKDIDPELIAKITKQESSEGARYTSPGSAQSPRYDANDMPILDNLSPFATHDIVKQSDRMRFGDTSIAQKSQYDIFDANGENIAGKANGGLGSTLMEGLQGTGYSIARAAVSSALLLDEVSEGDLQKDIDYKYQLLDNLDDAQQAELFYNKPVYVRNNVTGKVEKKTYGDLASDFEKGARGVLSGLPENVLIGILGVMTAPASGTAMGIGRVAAGYYGPKVGFEEYGKLRREGYSKEDAITASAAKAAIVMGTEGAMGKAFSMVPGSKAVAGKVGRMVAGDAIVEGIQEGTEELGNVAVDKFVLDKDVSDIGERVGMSALGGAIAGPAIGGAIRGAGKLKGVGPTVGGTAKKGLSKLIGDVSSKDVKKDNKVKKKAKAEPKVEDAETYTSFDPKTNESYQADAEGNRIEEPTTPVAETVQPAETPSPVVLESNSGQAMVKPGDIVAEGAPTGYYETADMKNMKHSAKIYINMMSAIEAGDSSIEIPKKIASTANKQKYRQLKKKLGGTKKVAEALANGTELLQPKRTEAEIKAQKDAIEAAEQAQFDASSIISAEASEAPSSNYREGLTETREVAGAMDARRTLNAIIDEDDQALMDQWDDDDLMAQINSGDLSGIKPVEGLETVAQSLSAQSDNLQEVDESKLETEQAEYDQLLKEAEQATSTEASETTSTEATTETKDETEGVPLDDEGNTVVINTDQGISLRYKSKPKGKNEEHFIAEHFPEEGVTKITKVKKGKKGKQSYPIKQNTAEFKKMTKDGSIGKFFNSKIKTSDALVDTRSSEQEHGGTTLTAEDKAMIKGIDKLNATGHLIKDGKLAPAGRAKLAKMPTRVVGNLITSARESKDYDALTVKALEEYYNENYGKSNKGDDSDSDDTPKGGGIKSHGDALEIVNGIDADIKSTVSDIVNIKEALNSLVEVSASKFHKVGNKLAKRVRIVFSKIKHAIRRLGDEFADVVNAYYLDSNNGLVMSVVPNGKDYDQLTPSEKKAEAIKSKAEALNDNAIEDHILPEDIKKNTPNVVYSETLSDNVELITNILNDHEVIGRLQQDDVSLLKALRGVAEDNSTVNLTRYSSMFDSESFDDHVSGILHALQTGDKTKVSEAFNEAREDNKAHKDEVLQDAVDEIYNEAKDQENKGSLIKDFNKALGVVSGGKFKLPNYFTTMVYRAKTVGETYWNMTWKPADEATSKQHYIENTLLEPVTRFLDKHHSKISKLMGQHNGIDLSSIATDDGDAKTTITVNPGLVSERELEPTKVDFEDLLLINSFDVERHLTDDDTYKFVIPSISDRDVIELTEMQIYAIQDYVDSVLDAPNNALIREYFDLTDSSFKNIANAYNGNTAMQMVSGRNKNGFLDGNSPFAMTNYANRVSADSHITLESGPAKSMKNNHDKGLIPANDRVFHVTPMTEAHRRLAVSAAKVMAWEENLSVISSISNRSEVRDALEMVLGESEAKEAKLWVDYLKRGYDDGSGGVETLTGIEGFLASNYYKKILAAKAFVGFKQLPSIAAASYTLDKELIHGNDARVKAKLAASVAKSTITYTKNILHVATGKGANREYRMKDYISRVYTPQAFARKAKGYSFEVRQLLQRENGKPKGLGHKDNWIVKLGASPGKLASTLMKNITFHDTCAIEGIWNTILSEKLSEYRKEGIKVPKPVVDYIEGVNGVGIISTKTVAAMEEYLQTVEEGSVDILNEAGDLLNQTIAETQPNNEGHNVINLKHTKDANVVLARFATFLSSARSINTARVMDASNQVYRAIKGGNWDEIKEALGRFLKTVMSAMIISASMVTLNRIKDRYAHPEKIFSNEDIHFVKQMIDSEASNNELLNLANNTINLVTRKNGYYHGDFVELIPVGGKGLNEFLNKFSRFSRELGSKGGVKSTTLALLLEEGVATGYGLSILNLMDYAAPFTEVKASHVKALEIVANSKAEAEAEGKEWGKVELEQAQYEAILELYLNETDPELKAKLKESKTKAKRIVTNLKK